MCKSSDFSSGKTPRFFFQLVEPISELESAKSGMSLNWKSSRKARSCSSAKLMWLVTSSRLIFQNEISMHASMMRDAENAWKTDALWYTNKLPIWCGLQFWLCLSRIIRSAGLTAQKTVPGFHISNLSLIVFSMCPNSKTHETIGALIFLPVLLTLRDQITFGPSGRWRLRRNLHATRALQMHLSVWILKISKNANFLDQPTRLGKQSSLHWFLSLLAQFHVLFVHTISHPATRKMWTICQDVLDGPPKPKTYPSHTAFASSGGKGNAVSPECGVEHLLENKSRDNLNGTVTFTCHLESCTS